MSCKENTPLFELQVSGNVVFFFFFSHKDVFSVVDFVGGDDFTNTILVFIRLGDFVACGHFDQTEVVIGEPDCGVLRMVEELEEAAALAEGDESQLHCWIVGGFMDENKHSSAILGLILASLNHCSRVCDIRLACSERLNQSADAPRPVVVGAAFSSAQGTVIPAHWTHLGPAVGMRTALACSGPETLSRVYDWKRDCLVVHFQYAALSAAADLLQLTDDQLRDACSTSSYETDRFAKTLRAGLTFLYQHPDHKEVFADGPVEFSRNEQLGAWMLVKKKQ